MFVRSVLSSYSRLLAGVSLALMAAALAGCNDTVAEKAEPPGHGDAARMRSLHAFLFNKWYFDELYDVLFVRPVRALGEVSSNVFERTVIQGIVGGTELAVRAGNSFIRVVQSGLVRYYALMLLIGVGALGLYFLVVSR